MSKILRVLYVSLALSLCLLLTACPGKKEENKSPEREEQKFPKIKKKVLIVDSYHRGYFWNDGILSGAFRVFNNIKLKDDDSLDCSTSKVDVRLFRMDTKRNPSVEFKKQAALKAKKIIDEWKPDVVIACDDNATKYLVVPFLKGKDIPVVFCGLNWDASEYGLPCKNITGMVEVSAVPQMLPIIRKFAKGDRVGFLAPDVLSNHRTAKYVQKRANVKFSHEIYVKNIDEWKKAFLKLQNETDMLFLINLVGLEGSFTKEQIKVFTYEYTRIPSLSILRMVAPYTLFCSSKVPAEQGEWAAKTAMKILNGASPDDIPVTRNKEMKIFLNMKLADKLGIKFPKELIEKAHFVEESEAGF